MIAAARARHAQKTPNEIALTILLSGLTIIFLLAIATLQPLAAYSGGPVAVADPHRLARVLNPPPRSAGCSRPSPHRRAWTG